MVAPLGVSTTLSAAAPTKDFFHARHPGSLGFFARGVLERKVPAARPHEYEEAQQKTKLEAANLSLQLVGDTVRARGQLRLQSFQLGDDLVGRKRQEDAEAADEMFKTLMGEKVEPRSEFIKKNALDVKNLDV